MNKNGMADQGSTTQGVEERIDSIKETMKGLVDQGAQKVETIKNRVVEAKEQAVTRGSDVLDRASAMIKTHPIKSVAIAFGVGYIGMRLFRR